MTISTLSREKFFAIFRPIFLRTRVPPCVFSKNRQNLSKIAFLKPLAKTLGPTNLKISRGSVFFVQGYTKRRGGHGTISGSFKKLLQSSPPLTNPKIHQKPTIYPKTYDYRRFFPIFQNPNPDPKTYETYAVSPPKLVKNILRA